MMSITGPNMGGKSTYIRQASCFGLNGLPISWTEGLVPDSFSPTTRHGNSQQMHTPDKQGADCPGSSRVIPGLTLACLWGIADAWNLAQIIVDSNMSVV